MARYTAYRRNQRPARRWLVWTALVAILVVGTWYFFFRDNSPETENGNSTTQPTNGGENRTAANDNSHHATTLPAPATGTAVQRKAALDDLTLGRKLLRDNKLIEARKVLSKAMLSGFLNPADQKRACTDLTKLADRTIFSRKIYDSDPYIAKPYTMQSGDRLEKVERTLKLHVPWQGLLIINTPSLALRIHTGQELRMDHLSSLARKIRDGRSLKMIKGPFHAIVYKKQHVIDLYLYHKGAERVFVRRMPVGLGKEGITPVGTWKVSSKLVKKPWTRTGNDGRRTQIAYGTPGYAFGKKGFWIGLKGTDENTKDLAGYGIHSTDDPSSIGKDASEGCIRLSDSDIDLVFALFYENWSTVEIRP